MNILVFVTNSLLLLVGLSLAASDSSKNKSGKKPSEASKEEKANAKLPPCAACGNLVASFEQVGHSAGSQCNQMTYQKVAQVDSNL